MLSDSQSTFFNTPYCVHRLPTATPSVFADFPVSPRAWCGWRAPPQRAPRSRRRARSPGARARCGRRGPGLHRFPMGRSSRPAKKYTGSMSYMYVIRLRTRCPGILHECGNAGAVPPQTRCSPSKTGPSRFCCDYFVRVLPGHPVCSHRGDQHRGVAPTALLAREGLVLAAAQPALLTCAESPAWAEDCGETTK